MVWAHKYPDLYEWMFRLSHSDFVALVWGMEMLSQQGILLAHGDKDLIVLTDEGYLQRLAWNFIERDDEAEIDKISALLPPDFVTIYMMIDPKLSFERTKSRRKGVPIGLKCSNEAATLAKFTRYSVMLDRFIEARQALGHSVMRVNAMQDVEKVAKDVVQHLTPLLPPPLLAKKKRGAPL
jgi:thymidylate kinase